MQSGRMFEIVYLLLERRRMTARELAERFEVSERTIYRDVDALSAAGIPIYAAKGKGGGIGLLENFVLDRSVLSSQEQKEILFGLQTLSATRAAEADTTLQRISSLFRQTAADWIDVDFSPWGGGEAEREKFRLLKQALLENQVVAFDYDSSYGLRSHRKVEPHKLRFKYGGWYLSGYCLEKHDFRTFKIPRMECLALTGERFVPRGEPPELECGPAAAGQIVELEMKILKPAAYRAHDEFDQRFVRQTAGGDYLVRAWYPENGWLYGYLLSFGEHLEVLSPPRIRVLLREKAARIAARYEDEATE